MIGVTRVTGPDYDSRWDECPDDGWSVREFKAPSGEGPTFYQLMQDGKGGRVFMTKKAAYSTLRRMRRTG